jgi:hypothetical protein
MATEENEKTLEYRDAIEPDMDNYSLRQTFSKRHKALKEMSTGRGI